MRNASLGVVDLPALEFDAGCVLELLAPPLPIVIENVPFARGKRSSGRGTTPCRRRWHE